MVAIIFEDSGKQAFVSRDCLSVLSTASCAWVSTSQEGRTAWGTNRTLAIRARECDSVFDDAVDIRSTDQRISQGMNRVVSLLVTTNPQDIRRRGRHTSSLQTVSSMR